jgi:acetyl esterase/lipase
MAMKPIPYSEAAGLDPRITAPRPVIDPNLVPIVDSFLFPEELDVDFLRGVATDGEAFVYNAETILKDNHNWKHAEFFATGSDNNEVALSVFTPKNPTSKALPALYHVHGGGMVSGDRFTAMTQLIDLLEGSNSECVIISVEYRLCPETRAPGPAEDCYAGLLWTSKHASNIGVNPAEIIVFGVSGGAPLAAATCLMARDQKAPTVPIKGQMLLAPMLDDRCESISDQQFEYGIPWCGTTNRMAWKCALGDERGKDTVTQYQAPSRAVDLSDLPPTYIDVAECEVFRDPAVMYAMNMWRCGSTCELHVWPGAFHLFDGIDNPEVPLIRAAIGAKRDWLKRMMTVCPDA